MLPARLTGVGIQAIRALSKKKKMDWTTDDFIAAADNAQLVGMLREELDENFGIIVSGDRKEEVAELEDMLGRWLHHAKDADYVDAERPIVVIIAAVLQAYASLSTELEQRVEELESRLTPKNPGLHVLPPPAS